MIARISRRTLLGGIGAMALPLPAMAASRPVADGIVIRDGWVLRADDLRRLPPA